MEEKVIGWFDPSIGSKNTGDQIIADAVEQELTRLLPEAILLRIPTQSWLSQKERLVVDACDHFIVGGTNLLNGNIPKYLQWKLDPQLLHKISGRTSLLGVGWWQYNNDPNLLSSAIWRKVLNHGVHSIRDQYTVNMLSKIGIPSLDTSCVTMWELPDEIEVGPQKCDEVLITITDYHRDPVQDKSLINGLKQRYSNLVAWPQSEKDVVYLRTLDRNITILGSSLKEYNDALLTNKYDFVGTRLHAGIRALQLGVKATIVAVDNRAPEIARTTGLPVIGRDLAAKDWEVVENRDPIRISKPYKNIETWRSQLRAKLR